MESSANCREGEEWDFLFLKAFSIPLIREKILEYAIYDDHKSKDTPYFYNQDLGHVRLVSKTWLESTSRIIRLGSLSIKDLDLRVTENQDKFIMDGEITQKMVLMKQAAEILTSPHRLDDTVSHLPLQLLVSDGLLRAENHSDLSKYLKFLGPSLDLIRLEFSKHTNIPTYNIFPQCMPSLSSLVISWRNIGIRKHGNFGCFVQTILDGTTKLTNLAIRTRLPLRNLRLPATLTYVQLYMPHSEMLFHSPLPRLTTLFLRFTSKPNTPSPVPEGMISKILETFSQTLIHLELTCSGFSTLVQVPVMKSLKTLSIKSESCVWEGKNDSGFEKCLPNLENLLLSITDEAAWFQWMINCHNIKSLKLFQTFKTIKLGGSEVSMITKAFPNVESFHASLNYEGMQVMFREMGKLKTLTLHIGKELGRGDSKWRDALLGMTSEDRVDALRTAYFSGKDHWRDFEPVRDANAVSILNLTELTHLTISATPANEECFEFRHEAFYFGFLKMPKLSHLTFGGCKPLPELIEIWTKERNGTMEFPTNI